MKIIYYISVFLVISIQEVLSQSIYVLEIESPEELHEFFNPDPTNIPVISGHRGGIVAGFPENSIEAMENTIKRTHAMFELDPRITKDSVIVLMHDETLDRTTNFSGKLIDFNFSQLNNCYLADKYGEQTLFKIPTLKEVIEWSKGKTIINLDKKNVPFKMIADLVIELDATSHVMLTVHHPDEAKYYLSRDKRFMFSAFIRNLKEFNKYDQAEIPWDQMIAYVGPLSKPENKELYSKLHQKNVMVMVSAASSYDKGENKIDRFNNYCKVFQDGADILESDLPIDVAKAINIVENKGAKNAKFFSEIKQ
ncbi:Glycerophosphoryl diester phosphodiesterase [Indibacter alkaliphilus LW1]|uniref:Glycerophosphoryl diester phosphodiesterase n=1 Tax=Indibacter alkaliphilus (strain CCUG 57479 / KCTC 22604 / LW1) TaxID=1189612 RepID=S2D8T7_INDAL|nr:glycerophosphodiester phosphodiesterase family protein [Indibacter alkaliphilus]EOZ95339.1 Glycerophosphoryl diester phosphodiesterase [Indibacter alkaliphilus LW1]